MKTMKKTIARLGVSVTSLLLFATPVFAQAPADGDMRGTLDKVINQFVNWAAVFAGLIALGFLIYAGIKYVTSAGDPGKTEEAQKQIVSALIGLAIVVLSYTILRVALYLFGVGFGAGALDPLARDLLPTTP